MRKISIAFAVIAVIFAITCSAQKTALEIEEAAVKAVLDQYLASVATEKMDLYAKLVDHDPQMVNFGGAGQPIVGWDALKKVMERQFEAASETEITIDHLAIHVSEPNTLAWATGLWNFKAVMDESPVDLRIRCTWVLEKRDNGWVIVHFHKSMAAAT